MLELSESVFKIINMLKDIVNVGGGIYKEVHNFAETWKI